jgi:hypothetical protein
MFVGVERVMFVSFGGLGMESYCSGEREERERLTRKDCWTRN